MLMWPNSWPRLRPLVSVDAFFDNVGSELLDIAAPVAARVVICGAISQNQHLDDVRGPKLYLQLAERNVSMRGFVVTYHWAHFPEATLKCRT
jgi:NADPH-dependent curcumin reductase CurA